MSLKLFNDPGILKINGFLISPDSKEENLVIIYADNGLNVATIFQGSDWGGSELILDQIKNSPIKVIALTAKFANIEGKDWGNEIYERLKQRASIIFDVSADEIIALSNGEKTDAFPTVEYLNGISFSKESTLSTFDFDKVANGISNTKNGFFSDYETFDLDETTYRLEFISNFKDSSRYAKTCLILTDAPLQQIELQHTLEHVYREFSASANAYECIVLMNPYKELSEFHQVNELKNRFSDTLNVLLKKLYSYNY